jgi:hypothetical protein
MNKAQQTTLFAAALTTARGLPTDDPNRARLADAMKALLCVKLDDAAFPLDITEAMVRNPRAELGQNYFKIAKCLRRLQKHDIGRRCYLVAGIVQAENDAQRDARVQR